MPTKAPSLPVLAMIPWDKASATLSCSSGSNIGVVPELKAKSVLPFAMFSLASHQKRDVPGVEEVTAQGLNLFRFLKPSVDRFKAKH
jgi:hypothetical protein